MKLENIFEDDIKQIMKSMRSRRKNRAKDSKVDMKLARRKNNPAKSNHPDMQHDGEGDNSEGALTNFQAGGV